MLPPRLHFLKIGFCLIIVYNASTVNNETTNYPYYSARISYITYIQHICSLYIHLALIHGVICTRRHRAGVRKGAGPSSLTSISLKTSSATSRRCCLSFPRVPALFRLGAFTDSDSVRSALEPSHPSDITRLDRLRSLNIKPIVSPPPSVSSRACAF